MDEPDPDPMSRYLVSASQWAQGREVADGRELLHVLGLESVTDLETWVYGSLSGDPGGVGIEIDFGGFVVLTPWVTMWVLPYPFTGEEFDAYLAELNDRLAVAGQVGAWDPEDDLSAVAETFGASLDDWEEAMGSGWSVVDLDWDLDHSGARGYLTDGDTVLGFSDLTAVVFRRREGAEPPADRTDLQESDVERIGEVDDIWRDGGPDLALVSGMREW